MFTPYSVLLLMLVAMFLLGLATFVTGIIILTLRVSGQDVKTIAVQSSRLAQKGIAEDVAGLVGNISTLLQAMNDLVRTTAGVGIFLAILGLILMAASSWIAFQIYRMPL